MRSVCVYCGSSPGVNPAFRSAAAALGALIAQQGRRLVYGGGHVGLMGVLADAALRQGGQVHGVITRALETKEVAHLSLSALTVVESMHERKAAMADMADAFVMLPGGFGTLDEFFEVVTWTQLGVHEKPCGILEVGSYFEPLLALFDTAERERFVRSEHRRAVVIETDPATLLARLDAWQPVATDKWLDRTER